MLLFLQILVRELLIYSMIFIILGLCLLILIFAPSLWVKHVLSKYSQPADRYPGTGGQLARQLLDHYGMHKVGVEATDSGDHYDPFDKCVRLTPDKLNGCSLTAITVAAHEVGHALQDHTGYLPLHLRTRLAKLAQPVQKVGAGILLAAPLIVLLTRAVPVGALMILGGLLTLGFATIVHFITLPMEWNASFSRALPMLQAGDYLHKNDLPHAKRLLLAAAMTYVAASLMSLLNVSRWWFILRR